MKRQGTYSAAVPRRFEAVLLGTDDMLLHRD